MTEKRKLLTLRQYEAMTPRQQGYATYMQAEVPGAVIPKKNPHPPGSPAAEEWDTGTQQAYISVLDCDDD